MFWIGVDLEGHSEYRKPNKNHGWYRTDTHCITQSLHDNLERQTNLCVNTSENKSNQNFFFLQKIFF